MLLENKNAALPGWPRLRRSSRATGIIGAMTNVTGGLVLR